MEERGVMEVRKLELVYTAVDPEVWINDDFVCLFVE